MKVIEITKRFRNGEIKKLMVVDQMDVEAINDAVEYWCEGESSGAVYGWSSTWEFVEDRAKIMRAVEEEVQELQDTIRWKSIRLDELRKFYNS